MPTYEYACTNADCGNRFDLVQSFSDPAATECPVCGQRVRKVYGAVGVVFKGSGFYRNDSRDSGKRATASADKAGGGDAAASGGSSESAASSHTPAGKDASSSGGTASPVPAAAPSKPAATTPA